LFLPVVWLVGAAAAPAAEPAKTALVLLSNTPCVVSLDGSKAADIHADEPLRLEVAPGEYVVSAVAADGRRWSKILRAEGAKMIVQIDFGRNASASASVVPAPAAASVSPVAPVAPAAASVVAAAAAPPPAPRPALAPASPGRAGFSWVEIPAGEYEMGCSEGDAECNPAESPRRRVAVGKPFEIMDRLVSVAEFRDWASSSGRKLPSQPKWSTDDTPVVNVTWDEAAGFCSAMVGRLPTEIEWEYAARAGSTGPRYGEIDAIAWYAGNSDKRAHPVGQKSPNGFGLYDMLGNVWEWNADVFQNTPGAASDSSQGGHNDMRSLRGGSWRNKARQIRASNRGRLAPDDREDDDGFRCARDAAPR
jgi:formylglycine-generating enzyme required for sulfatase activity